MDTPNSNPELWIPVVGWEGIYEVSDAGRVKRVLGGSGAQAGKILLPQPDGKGYVTVNLRFRGRRSVRFIHSLVAEAFICPQPEGQEVNHINFRRADNALSNLEWMTRPQNIDHSHFAGRMSKGEDRWNSKLTERDVSEIRALIASGESQASIATRFNVCFQSVNLIHLRKTWTHI